MPPAAGSKNVKGEVVAVVCSDLHLCHTPPRARRAEGDWYECMRCLLVQVSELGRRHAAPIICAGDIFDKWNPPTELVNFALDVLPKMYAVPGQHDLRHHVYEDYGVTGYGVLMKAGVVSTLDCDASMTTEHHILVRDDHAHRLRLWGFPWGHDLQPMPTRYLGDDCCVNLLVAHKYVHTPTASYPGAPSSSRITNLGNVLDNYSAAVFGDNHKTFHTSIKARPYHTPVLNPGSLMQRNIDQQDHQPTVGLLWHNGPHVSWELVKLDVPLVNWTYHDDVAVVPEDMPDMADFIAHLDGMHLRGGFDYRQAMLHWLDTNEVSQRAKRVLLGALGCDE